MKYVENPIPKEFLNKIFCKSSEKMKELPDNSVHLMVTSPPYNVGKEYDKDFTLEEYLEFLKEFGRKFTGFLFPVEESASISPISEENHIFPSMPLL